MSSGWGAVGRLGGRIAATIGSMLAAGCWLGLLWLQFFWDGKLISRVVVGCQASAGDVAIQVAAAIAVVIGTALFSAGNAFLLVRFAEAWWLRIAPVLLFLALALGLLAMAWLTVLLGAMWVDGGLGRSDAQASHRDPAGAILMGWLLAPIVVSLVALVFPFAARPRIRSDGRLVALSATIPLALYGVGVVVTVVLQAARCPG